MERIETAVTRTIATFVVLACIWRVIASLLGYL